MQEMWRFQRFQLLSYADGSVSSPAMFGISSKNAPTAVKTYAVVKTSTHY
jgi:hypothetical protein